MGGSETLLKSSSYIVISDNYGNIDSFKGTLNQNRYNIIPAMSGDGNVMGFVNQHGRCKSCKSLNLYRIDYKSKSVKAVNHANGTRWNGIASNYKGDKIILAEYNTSYYLMQNKSLKDYTNKETIFISNSPNFPPNYVQNMKLTKSGNELYGFYHDGNKGTLIRQDVSKSYVNQPQFTWQKSFNSIVNDYAISSNAKSIAVCADSYIYQSGNFGKSWAKSSKAFTNPSTITMSSDGQYRCVNDSNNFNINNFYTSNDWGKSWIKETQIKGNGTTGSGLQAMSANGDFIYALVGDIQVKTTHNLYIGQRMKPAIKSLTISNSDITIGYEMWPKKLTNDTIQSAVNDWLNPARKESVIQKYGPIQYWDTSQVQDMSTLFITKKSFNDDISRWNTNKVTDMGQMFLNTTFNQDIGKWNTRQVTDMSAMFAGAEFFNYPLKSWNTSSVKNMNFMFSYAKSFNQNLKSWSITKSAKSDSVLFANNSPLGKSNLPTGIIKSNIIITQNAVAHISDIITKSHQFNDTIKSWNTSKVTDMSDMFCSIINYISGIENTPFNQDIGKWNTNNVKSMAGMFLNTPFNQDIGKWNTCQVTDMTAMFTGAEFFNYPLKS